MFQKVFDFLVTTVNEDGNLSYYPTSAGNVALVLVVIILFVAMLAITGTRNKKLNAKQIAFSAVAVTLAVVVSFFKVEFPFGGSITLFRMFFICLIGYLYGPKVGFLTGVAYGFLDLMLEPYIVHPVQLLLDYPIAFGCLGLSGVFAKSKFGLVKGYVFGVFGRYLCHAISGLIFFSIYAGSQNPIIYTAVYNASYILPEAIMTVVLLLIPVLQKGISEVKRMTVEG